MDRPVRIIPTDLSLRSDIVYSLQSFCWITLLSTNFVRIFQYYPSVPSGAIFSCPVGRTLFRRCRRPTFRPKFAFFYTNMLQWMPRDGTRRKHGGDATPGVTCSTRPLPLQIYTVPIESDKPQTYLAFYVYSAPF